MTFSFDALKAACSEEWKAYREHEFVRRLGAGDLPADAFRHYLKQDYLFLLHFARAYGLAVYKSRTLTDLRHAHGGLKAILDIELDLHINYCKEWDISQEELMALPEARATMAYTRYVLDTGNRGDLLDMHVALAPCLVGYAEIGSWLKEQSFTVFDGNAYEPWMKMYLSEEFQAAAREEVEWLDTRLKSVDPVRFEELVGVFRDATRLEIDFWQMGLDQRM